MDKDSKKITHCCSLVSRSRIIHNEEGNPGGRSSNKVAIDQLLAIDDVKGVRYSKMFTLLGINPAVCYIYSI